MLIEKCIEFFDISTYTYFFNEFKIPEIDSRSKNSVSRWAIELEW